MAQHHGHRARPVARNHGQVRVAQAGRPDADQQLVGTWRVKFDFANLERLALRIGRGRPDGFQHGGTNFHSNSLLGLRVQTSQFGG